MLMLKFAVSLSACRENFRRDILLFMLLFAPAADWSLTFVKTCRMCLFPLLLLRQPLLCAFAKFGEAIISFVMSVSSSVCPSVCLSAWNNSAHMDAFSWDLIYEYFWKICRENWLLIKIWQEYWYEKGHETKKNFLCFSAVFICHIWGECRFRNWYSAYDLWKSVAY